VVCLRVCGLWNWLAWAVVCLHSHAGPWSAGALAGPSPAAAPAPTPRCRSLHPAVAAWESVPPPAAYLLLTLPTPLPSPHSAAANILLSRHGTAKICDIGMARVLGNKEYLSMLSGMGTFAWRCAARFIYCCCFCWR
jgi:hypothetical protein